MDVEKIFHMNGGSGLTSYTNNSSLQKKASDMVKHITLEAVEELYMTTKPKNFSVADLGCSSGPNTLSIVREIIDCVRETSRKNCSLPPETIQVFLNDLPTNDFNSIFQLLPDFLRKLNNCKSSMVFVGGYPGSFYTRLFPNNCLHFVYSSYSLHWLSKVPGSLYDEHGKSINKEAIYICKASPEEVSRAYFEQFKDDFSLFLQLRSQEVMRDGRMVLILVAREGPDHVDRGNSFLWEILHRSFAQLVTEGIVEKEKLESYEVHFYAPSKEEIEYVVKIEGSFKLDRIEAFTTESEIENHGVAVAMTVRAIQESMIRQHFGGEILDALFDIYARMVNEEMAKEKIRPITIVLVLRKI